MLHSIPDDKLSAPKVWACVEATYTCITYQHAIAWHLPYCSCYLTNSDSLDCLIKKVLHQVVMPWFLSYLLNWHWNFQVNF